MRALVYVGLIALFLALSWLIRLLVSNRVSRRVEEEHESNGDS